MQESQSQNSISNLDEQSNSTRQSSLDEQSQSHLEEQKTKLTKEQMVKLLTVSIRSMLQTKKDKAKYDCCVSLLKMIYDFED